MTVLWKNRNVKNYAYEKFSTLVFKGLIFSIRLKSFFWMVLLEEFAAHADQ